jgi:tetratricopeptide (TPR) repeat protein
MRPLAALALVALTCVSASALADTPPSVWDRARDPKSADAYALHETVQQALLRLTPQLRLDEGLYQAVLDGVLARLKNNGAETSKSALLRYDLALVYEEKRDYPTAAKLYRAAIAEFPDHPATLHAWGRLANACGHLGDNLCEKEAYRRQLELETEDDHRVVPTLNLAETMMHLGDLKEAIAGYREALRISSRLPPRETAPLATWGLAIALDRSGDRLEAEKEARFSIELQRSIGMSNLLDRADIVFFVPAYEVHWYKGLGAAAQARVAHSAREAAKLWARAEEHFAAYVEAGEPQHDRWLAIAKAHLAQAKSERARVEKTVPREPPPSDAQDVKL